MLPAAMGDVAVAISGTSLTLTSDNSGNHTVNVYRLDANNIEVDGVAGTTINGASSQVFGFSNLFGITVNVGYGYDKYDIFSKSGYPALNVGCGGVVFQGGGGTGDDLEVFNASTNAMSILGNITVQGTAFHNGFNPLIQSGTVLSSFTLKSTNSGSLTVCGSVAITLQGTGSGGQSTSIMTVSQGGLNILGSVTESLTQTNSGSLTNQVASNGPGNVAIGGCIMQTANAASGSVENDVEVESSSLGNLTVGGAVKQTASCAANDAAVNYLRNQGTGNLKIGGSVVETVTNTGFSAKSSANNEALFYNSDTNLPNTGSVMIGGWLTQVSDCSSANGAQNYIYQASQGAFTVALFVAQTANSDSLTRNELQINGSGSVAIGGAFTQKTTGGASSGVNLVSNPNAGSLTIGFILAQSSSGAAKQCNIIQLTMTGNMTAKCGISQTASGGTSLSNKVHNGGTGALKTGGSVVQNSTASSGTTSNLVYTDNAGGVSIGGNVCITEWNPTATGQNTNSVHTKSTGSITIGGVISITSNNTGPSSNNTGQSSNSTYNNVSTSSGGAISALGMIINALGNQYQYNDITADGGAVMIGGLGVTIFESGTAHHNLRIYTAVLNSPLTIAGSVTIVDTGSGDSEFQLYSYAQNSPATILGNVTYVNCGNITGHSFVKIYGGLDNYKNSAVQIYGALNLNLAKTSGIPYGNGAYAYNTVAIGSNSKGHYDTIVNGCTSITGGNGQDNVTIQTSELNGGLIMNLLSKPSPGNNLHDTVEIDGSLFGRGATVLMSGPEAELNINNGNSNQPTQFNGLLLAVLSGADPRIQLAAGTGSGYSKVIANASSIVIGTYKAGGILKLNQANVSGIGTVQYFTVINV